MRTPFVLVLFAALTAPAFADDNASSAKDDTLIVYGVRLAQPATELGSSVTVITAADIEARGYDFVLDALASAPGVTITQNGSYGGVASVRIRGAASEQTLVIVDGVVVNDPTSPGGGFDFSRVDPSNVDRIEVLKGPQSTLWGTDAIGGVVNIITKRPVQGISGGLFAQTGSFGTVRGGGELAGASEHFDYRIAATHMSSDGISKADEDNGNDEEDPFESTTLSARAGVAIAENTRLQATVLWTDAQTSFDTFSFGDQGNIADGDEESDIEEVSATLSLSNTLFEARLANFLLIGWTDIERESFAAGEPTFASEGDRTTIRYQGTLTINETNTLAFGAEREKNDSNGEEVSIDGLFALYELNATDSLTLSAGLRQDDHEVFGIETTSRVAIAYQPTEQVTLTATWGEGFKAPTLFQTTFFCCGAEAANQGLRPETSDAYDVGVTFGSQDDRGSIGLSYFEQDTTDLITFSFAVGGYENIAEAKSRGIELQASYKLVEWASVTASYAYIDAEDQDGEQLPRVPEHSGDLVLALTPDGPWTMTATLRYNGSEQDPNGEVDAWTRLDLSARYAISDKVEWYARIENLFDNDYQQVIGYGTPGLSGNIGARLRF